MEAHGAAKLLRQVAHLRTPQQDIERPPGAPTFSGQQMIDHDLLLGCHLVVVERLKPIAYQDQLPWIRSLLRSCLC